MGLSAFVSLIMVSMFMGGTALSRRFIGEETVFRRAHVVANRLTTIIHEADLTQASYGPDWLAVPGARGDGTFKTDPKTGQPQWNQLWLLYSNGSELRLAQQPWPGNPKSREGGTLLTGDLAGLNVTMEQVTVLNDPIASNSTVPTTSDVTALVHLDFSLYFVDRQGVQRRYRYQDRIEGWNSYARSAPPVPPLPSGTPTPENSMPLVPKDWK